MLHTYWLHKSAVSLSQHLLFSELTQPCLRSQKVNKELTPSDRYVFIAKIHNVSNTPSPFVDRHGFFRNPLPPSLFTWFMDAPLQNSTKNIFILWKKNRIPLLML